MAHYVKNNPLIYVDPSGNSERHIMIDMGAENAGGVGGLEDYGEKVQEVRQAKLNQQVAEQLNVDVQDLGCGTANAHMLCPLDLEADGQRIQAMLDSVGGDQDKFYTATARMPSKEEAKAAAYASPTGDLARAVTGAVLEGASATATVIVNKVQAARQNAAQKQNAANNSADSAGNNQPANKGMNNPSTAQKVNMGNKVHYDKENGATGDGLPSELKDRYPHTEFTFARRRQPGPDVTVVPGTVHPSDQSFYPGSTWAEGNQYGDFKPGTDSGQRTFANDIKSGKLPPNTQYLPYDPNTGHLQPF